MRGKRASSHPPPILAARVVPVTYHEGPGPRLAVFTQGCALQCPGCINPELFRTSGGIELPVRDMVAGYEVEARRSGLIGVSWLGGEPANQAQAVAAAAAGVRAAGGTNILFTGFALDELRSLPRGAALLEAVDCVVAGRFERGRRSARRSAVGSDNQIVHDISGRVDLSCFESSRQGLTLVADGTVVGSGWPTLALAAEKALGRSARP